MNITDYLFLDDLRNPYHVTHVQLPQRVVWHTVLNYNEFVNTIEKFYREYQCLPKFIAFDHDLAEEHYRPSMYNPDEHYTNYYTDGTFTEKTGYDCAKWLVEFCIDKRLYFPEYICHSMNPIGRKNINSVIESGKKIIEDLINETI